MHTEYKVYVKESPDVMQEKAQAFISTLGAYLGTWMEDVENGIMNKNISIYKEGHYSHAITIEDSGYVIVTIYTKQLNTTIAQRLIKWLYEL